MRSRPILVALLLTPASTSAQWLPDSRLTNDPAISHTEIDGGRNVAVTDELLMVVWSDTRDGNEEIYFRERLLGVWSPALRLTNDPAASRHPAIGRVDGEVRVVWEDVRTGRPEIRIKRKVLGVWLADECLTCDAFESARPSIDHTGQHLVWEETKDGNREIYYRKLPFETAWEPAFRISDDAAESSHPSVASPRTLDSPFDPAIRVVAWQDQRDGNWEIYARYGDSFSGWDPEVRISSNPANSRFPSAAVEDDAFCSDIAFISHWVAWQDDRDGNEEIYFAEGYDGFWLEPGRITTTSLPSQLPSIGKTYVPVFGPFGAGLCSIPTLSWTERSSPASGTVLHLEFSAADPETISAIHAAPEHASMATFHESTSAGVVEGTLAVVWTDQRDGNEEIYLAEGSTIADATAVPEPLSDAVRLEIGLARPNPFRSETSATVRIPNETQLTVRIVDAAGRLVRTIHSGSIREGAHSFTWDGLTRSGTRAAAGTYFFVATSDERTGVRPVILIR